MSSFFKPGLLNEDSSETAHRKNQFIQTIKKFDPNKFELWIGWNEIICCFKISVSLDISKKYFNTPNLSHFQVNPLIAASSARKPSLAKSTWPTTLDNTPGKPPTVATCAPNRLPGKNISSITCDLTQVRDLSLAESAENLSLWRETCCSIRGPTTRGLRQTGLSDVICAIRISCARDTLCLTVDRIMLRGRTSVPIVEKVSSKKVSWV